MNGSPSQPAWPAVPAEHAEVNQHGCCSSVSVTGCLMLSGCNVVQQTSCLSITVCHCFALDVYAAWTLSVRACTLCTGKCG